ncbi:MAG: YARHG domain-containing protein [Ignavibacteria bacterium]|nr:YARHG domain-containing protein [Ignavibacteria bacterium]
MTNLNMNVQENKSNSTKIVLSLLGVLVILIIILVFTFFNKNNSTQIATADSSKIENKTKIESSESNPTNSDNLLKQRELDLKEQELRLKEKELDQKNKVETSTKSSTRNQSSSTPGRYPEGSDRYLSGADIQYLSKAELEIMRNEIFARHGYIFTKNEKMIRYFNSQSWYSPLYYDVNNMLTKIEKDNVALIKLYER